jgi:hypothetical protein
MGMSLLSFVALTLVAPQAHAEPNVEFGSDLWTPSLVLRTGVVIQSGAALAESALNNGQELRPRHTGRQTQVWPVLGSDLEIMAPALTMLPAAPRFFMRGGASFSFATDKDVTKEGDPQNFQLPAPPAAARVIGQGSSTNIELKSPILDAGFGAAFEFEAWDRPVRLRASFEYMRQRIKLRGKAHEARDAFGTVFLFSVRDTTTDNFDALGGGLGIEVDALRAGPIVTSVLGSGRMYHWLGDRTIEVRGEGNLGSTARWRYKLDALAFRVHVGMRFRWQPE